MNKLRNGIRPSTLMLIALVLVAMSSPGFAAKVLSKPIPHPLIYVYQAYCGSTCDWAVNAVFQGLPAGGFGGDVIGAVPGVLAIDPGGTQPLKGWPNYVSASLPTGPTDRSWTVTNVSLRKTVPRYVCTAAIGGMALLQQGSANIRLWWPLMYELPGTEWTLTITYKTMVWDDDGASGPNMPAVTHQDVWKWKVDATLASMVSLVKLFHQLPVGSCGGTLINGEALYTQLLGSLEALQSYPDTPNPEKTEDFYNFILLLEDCCLTVDCGSNGSEVGIRNTVENPACCKLLADADSVVRLLSIASAP